MGRPFKSITACPHIDRPHEARGMCRNCYSAWAYQNLPSAKTSRTRAQQRYHAQHPREKYSQHIQAAYGISLETYDALVLAQQGKCALCQKELRLLIDHDHLTGRIRGLLCYRCNTSIGQLGDSVEGLERAISYLQGRTKWMQLVH